MLKRYLAQDLTVEKKEKEKKNTTVGSYPCIEHQALWF